MSFNFCMKFKILSQITPKTFQTHNCEHDIIISLSFFGWTVSIIFFKFQSWNMRSAYGKCEQIIFKIRLKSTYYSLFVHNKMFEERCNKIASENTSYSRWEEFFRRSALSYITHNKVNIKIMHFLWPVITFRNVSFLPFKNLYSATYSANSFHVSNKFLVFQNYVHLNHAVFNSTIFFFLFVWGDQNKKILTLK